MQNVLRVVGLLLWVCLAGCASFRGPSLEFSAPRVAGRVVDDVTGEPVPGARVGRELVAEHPPAGGFWKGAEVFRRLQMEVRSAADGHFALASERVALLFSLGDVGFNLRLAVQADGYRIWQTNYPYRSLDTNAGPMEPRLETGEIRLVRR